MTYKRGNRGKAKQMAFSHMLLLLLKSSPANTSAFTPTTHAVKSPCNKQIRSKPEWNENNPNTLISIHESCRPRYTVSLKVSSQSSSSASSANRDLFTSRRESAVFVDWDPVPEIQRRIEQGIEYEHWPENHEMGDGMKYHNKFGDDAPGDGIQCVRGVIASLRGTNEEKSRLRSAHPDE